MTSVWHDHTNEYPSQPLTANKPIIVYPKGSIHTGTKDMNMPEEKQAPEWYTTKQAAEKMQITREAVQRLCRDGRITCEKWGRDWMVHRDSVESYEITVGGRGKKAGDD